MLKFYYNTGPNPMKVALFLEEAELDYKAIPLDTRKGDQHQADYLAINPNAKAPTLVDGDTIIFDSNAILSYLAEKTGCFGSGTSLTERGELLSWLMFVASGVGPYSGQAVHFKVYAPEEYAYSLNRYDFEARRHFQILNERLATRRYMLGDNYTLVDMAVWGWARIITRVISEEAAHQMVHLKRLVNEIDSRSAAGKVQELLARHSFKTEMDTEAHQHMFPSNALLLS